MSAGGPPRTDQDPHRRTATPHREPDHEPRQEPEPGQTDRGTDEQVEDETGHRHRSGSRPPARARLLEGLRHPSRGQILGGVLVGLLGFAMVTQLQARGDDDRYAGLRSADLIQVLNGLNAQSRRADSEIRDLQKTRSQLTDSSQRRQAAVSRAREEVSTLGILAGTIGAKGPGVRITINDPENKVSLNNLLDAVEELRSAGAEAMEFNDKVRVVAQTSFEQTDDGLVVDGQLLAAPYVIDAIGSPDTLAPVIDFAGGFGYDVGQAGGSVSVSKVDSLKITAVTKTASSDFASPSG